MSWPYFSVGKPYFIRRTHCINLYTFCKSGYTRHEAIRLIACNVGLVSINVLIVLMSKHIVHGTRSFEPCGTVRRQTRRAEIRTIALKCNVRTSATRPGSLWILNGRHRCISWNNGTRLQWISPNTWSTFKLHSHQGRVYPGANQDNSPGRRCVGKFFNKFISIWFKILRVQYRNTKSISSNTILIFIEKILDCFFVLKV